MKILKVVLFTFLGLFLVLLIGLFIFIKTFDVNKYVPQITQQIGKTIDRKVTIGHADLGLGLLKGLSVELQKITISDDPRFSTDNFLTLQSAYVGLDFLALIQKRQIAVTHVIITSPDISIVRLADGSINAQTLAPAAASKDTSPANNTGSAHTENSTSGPSMALPAILIKSISVRNARLTFEDQNKQMPLHLVVKDVSVEIKDLSLTDPFDFTISANAWALGQKNIDINGQCVLDQAHNAVSLSKLQIKSDLGQWDWDSVRKITPMLQSLPVWPQVIKGIVTIDIPALHASAKGLEGVSLQASLTDGFIKMKELLSPIDQIELKVTTDLNNLSVKQLEARVGSGQIGSQAEIQGLLTSPSYTYQLQGKSIKIEELIDQSKAPAELKGEFNGQFSGSGQGFDPQVMLANIKGEGDVAINKAKLEKMNLLKTILDKLNFIPGNIVSDAIETKIPADIKSQLDTDTTVLDQVQSKIKVENRIVTLSDAQIESSLFSVKAQGTVDFDMNTAIDVDTYLSTDISAALVKAAKPLQGLLDDQQRLYIPGNVEGKAPAVTYIPKVSDITKKVALYEGKAQITQQLQKVLSKNPAVQNLISSFLGGN